MGNFSDVWNSILGSVPTTKTGEKMSTHSSADFNSISKALFNEVDYTTKKTKTVNGEMVVEDVKPVEAFRQGMIKNILKKAGHDNAEAESLAMSIEVDNVNGLYEFVSEDLYQYMAAGKKFTFMPKEDFQGSINLNLIAEHDEAYHNPKTGEAGVSHQKAYKKLKADSTCPKHLKSNQ